MNFSWIDIVIVLIILIFALIGFKNGLLRTICNFVVLIAALILSYIFSTPVAKIIADTTTLSTNMYNSTYRMFYTKFGDAFSSEKFLDTINLRNFPPGFKEFLQKGIDSASSGVGTTIENLARFTTDIAMKTISYVLLFIAILIIGKVITIILDKVMKFPGLNLINKVSGLVMGLVIGIIIACVFSTTLYLFNIISTNSFIVGGINHSILIKYFYIGVVK